MSLRDYILRVVKHLGIIRVLVHVTRSIINCVVIQGGRGGGERGVCLCARENGGRLARML